MKQNGRKIIKQCVVCFLVKQVEEKYYLLKAVMKTQLLSGLSNARALLSLLASGRAMVGGRY